MADVVDPPDLRQWGIKVIKSIDAPGLSCKQGVLHRGGNSGFQAVNLAYLMGAERIILLGFDMMPTDGKKHWFGDHPDKMNVASSYPTFITAFNKVKPEQYGIEIWNCSRRTALKCFPCYDLDECLASL